MAKKGGAKSNFNRKSVIGGAVAGFLLLALVAGGIYLAFRSKDNKSGGDSKDRSQDISFSEVCKSIDANKLKETVKASSVDLKEDSVTRTETSLYIQNTCNFTADGDASVKGYINVIVQEFKDSTERDNQKLQVETFGKSIKDSEKVDGLGDVAYLAGSDAGSRIVVAKNGKRLTIIYPLASQSPADKEKLKEIAKDILAKL